MVTARLCRNREAIQLFPTGVRPAVAARAADTLLFDPAHKEWRISHPFPQKNAEMDGARTQYFGAG
jgi:hypothetical protein